MRRKDREITEFADMVAVMEKCDVCRLALTDGDYPYILPLNFGMTVSGECISLYFHGAAEGKKYELIQKNNKASFEMDCSHRLVLSEDSASCTMEYESIIGKGIVELLPPEETLDALEKLMSHYHGGTTSVNREVAARTRVFRLTVLEMTGKRRMKKKRGNGNETA